MKPTPGKNPAKIAVCLVAMTVCLSWCLPLRLDARQKVTELPELLVESSKRHMLHVLAYVREYSTLTTYSDTVTLFREKMVDFMLAGKKKSGYRGWRVPRVIHSESYYRFTDSEGLDSVSDTSRHNFSWSDWMGLPPDTELPETLQNGMALTDTIFGKYSPLEIWNKENDLVSLEVNVLADSIGRRWAPNLKSFFKDENIEFEEFKMRINYSNVLGNSIMRRDLTDFSYRVDARGRGHSMFRFNRRDEDFFATTDGEMYIIDMEFITEKEAKKWGKGEYDPQQSEIIEPAEAPRLSEETLALIHRVRNVDKNLARLDQTPDRNLIRIERKRSWGGNALRYLKNITGISDANAKRKQNANWNKFLDSRKNGNK